MTNAWDIVIPGRRLCSLFCIIPLSDTSLHHSRNGHLSFLSSTSLFLLMALHQKPMLSTKNCSAGIKSGLLRTRSHSFVRHAEYSSPNHQVGIMLRLQNSVLFPQSARRPSTNIPFVHYTTSQVPCKFGNSPILGSGVVPARSKYMTSESSRSASQLRH